MNMTTKASREDRIRERAYAIWKKAGEPEGEDKAHWAKACNEIDEEDGQSEVHAEPIASSALPTAEEFASPAEEGQIPADRTGNGIAAAPTPTMDDRRRQRPNGSRIARSA